MPAPFEDRDDVIVVVPADKIHEERLMADGPQGRGGEEGALEAVGLPFPDDPEGRAGPGEVVVIETVEETLDLDGRIEPSE